jgi:hypothetical protein
MFNWALDWFDVLAADGGGRRALWIVEENGSERACTFAELPARSNQVANWLRESGVARGDRIIVMLGNRVELWETILAATKLGAVIIRPRPCYRRPTSSIGSSAAMPGTSWRTRAMWASSTPYPARTRASRSAGRPTAGCHTTTGSLRILPTSMRNR